VVIEDEALQIRRSSIGWTSKNKKWGVKYKFSSKGW